MLYALVIGLVLAVIAYFSIQIVSGIFIDERYLSDARRAEREEKYLDELQAYVDGGELSSEDTDVLAEWVRDNRYLYVMIYKNDQLVLDSDSAQVRPGSPGSGEPGTEQPSDGSGGTEDRVDSGITVTFPTREDLIEYAKERDAFPIEMSDGIHLLVSMVDFTEYFYYDIFNIVSLIAAAVVLIVTIMVYFTGIIHRITLLAKDVDTVAAGDMDHSIRTKEGESDEISILMQNVENMRLSMLDNIAKEREAIDSNTELITSMSHDIRTPLTVMLGYIDVMRMKDTDGAMAEYISALETTALRLKEMSDDMFNYFLVFSDKYKESEIARYDVVTLFEQIISEKILLLREGGYEVTIDRGVSEESYSGVRITTDAPKLMRIAENIFSNIMKYADKAYPVLIETRLNGDILTVRIVNKISKDRECKESNGIGLRTCIKLAELSGIEFSYLESDGEFAVSLLFAISKEKENDE